MNERGVLGGRDGEVELNVGEGLLIMLADTRLGRDRMEKHGHLVQRPQSYLSFFAAAILVQILLPGCEIFDAGSSGSGNPEWGRIVVGKSIDSISPGMTTSEVKNILGPPDAVGLGDFAGFIYEYGEGSGTVGPVEIAILFAEDYDDRVVSMAVMNPYRGKTTQGIGIGSSIRRVHYVLGQPDTTHVTVWWGRLFRSVAGSVYGLNDSVTFVITPDREGQIIQISMLAMRFQE